MIVLSLEQLYLPSFNRAMSFVWFEKFSWTITLLTRICFLLKMMKNKKAKEVEEIPPSFFEIFVTVMKSKDDGDGFRGQEFFSVAFLN